MAFLGVGAGVAIVTISNTVSVGSAVAHKVRSPLPVGVIAAAPPGLGRKLVSEGFDLVGEGGVGGDKRGVRGNELLKDGFLVSWQGCPGNC